jgi:hypothetical protein
MKPGLMNHFGGFLRVLHLLCLKNILDDCGPINDVLQLLLSTCGWMFHFAKHPPQDVPKYTGFGSA